MAIRDCHGYIIQPGDIVRCVAKHYKTIYRGSEAEVLGITSTCVTLAPQQMLHLYDYPEDSRVTYLAQNFELVKRAPENMHLGEPHSRSNQKESTMSSKATAIQIAFRIPGGMSREEFMDYLVKAAKEKQELDVMMRKTPHELKRDLTTRINENPSERWYCVNTTLIAESPQPQIRFADW